MTMAQDGGKIVNPTHRMSLPPGTHFCQRLSRPQDHSAIGILKPVKLNASGNRKHTLNTRSIYTAAQSLRLMSFPLRQVASLLPPSVVTYTATILQCED